MRLLDASALPDVCGIFSVSLLVFRALNGIF